MLDCSAASHSTQKATHALICMCAVHTCIIPTDHASLANQAVGVVHIVLSILIVALLGLPELL